MGFPKDIDEMTESELRGELTLRADRRAKGWCDYCCREPHEKSCRFPKRHNDPRIAAKADRRLTASREAE